MKESKHIKFLKNISCIKFLGNIYYLGQNCFILVGKVIYVWVGLCVCMLSAVKYFLSKALYENLRKNIHNSAKNLTIVNLDKIIKNSKFF